MTPSRASLSEREFGCWVQELASGSDPEPRLLELLREHHAVYAGRGEQAVLRMRGFLLSVLARLDVLSPAVLPFLREEFETGQHPYALGAAARALARVRPLPGDWSSPIESALARIEPGDEFVQYETYPLDAFADLSTSASKELRKALRSLRLAAAAPSAPPETRTGMTLLGSFRARPNLMDMELEDHFGRRVAYRDHFVGGPSFVTFFYTRCNNPAKCSANISRWGELLKALVARDLIGTVRTAAITYDPAYDVPSRLLAYAGERGVSLDGNHRAFRVPEGFIEFQRAFGLNVGYSSATVNRHASEAFLLNPDGSIAEAIARTTWSVEDVLASLESMAPGSPVTTPP